MDQDINVLCISKESDLARQVSYCLTNAILNLLVKLNVKEFSTVKECCRQLRINPRWDMVVTDFRGVALRSLLQSIRDITKAPIVVLHNPGNKEDAIATLAGGAVYIEIQDVWNDLEGLEAHFQGKMMLRLKQREQLSRPETLALVALNPPENVVLYSPEDELVIDVPAHLTWLHGDPLYLTPTERKILLLLVEQYPDTISREKIAARIWGDTTGDDILRKYIQRLRLKLKDDPKNPKWIGTIFGVGYRFLMQLTQRRTSSG